MDYGYARVSTDDQTNDPQIKELARYGLTSHTIRTEKISGSVLANRRPVLSGLLKALRKVDTLTVVKLDRLLVAMQWMSCL
ncbi:recombinase family protein [Acetobacter sp. DmW_136]|uniref:recombinase family protein n=1 Tax=Acetobacter sp. DmW_136 TaxID=2591091 RepID=UPI001EE2D4E5|nr:recombinase family protein [Acetobacter sp. DmW_136]